jgi:hypothetical protein
LRVLLTHRALKEPVHGQCGVCCERRQLQQLVLLGADELPICHDCFKAAAHFARLSSGYPSCSTSSHLGSMALLYVVPEVPDAVRRRALELARFSM